MSLVSLETPKETSLVQNYLNSLGLKYFVPILIIYFLLLGLGDTSILTSLQKSDSGAFEWGNGNSAGNLPWVGKGSGDCATITEEGLNHQSCEAKSNFMCETVKETAASTTLKENLNVESTDAS